MMWSGRGKNWQMFSGTRVSIDRKWGHTPFGLRTCAFLFELRDLDHVVCFDSEDRRRDGNLVTTLVGRGERGTPHHARAAAQARFSAASAMDRRSPRLLAASSATLTVIDFDLADRVAPWEP